MLENFPDQETHNLLVWRRREIENYFLEPEYLSQSKFCRVSQDRLEQKVLQCANERLFLDAANYVVTSIREELKRNWIQKFSNPEEFSSREIALQRLKTPMSSTSIARMLIKKFLLMRWNVDSMNTSKS